MKADPRAEPADAERTRAALHEIALLATEAAGEAPAPRPERWWEIRHLPDRALHDLRRRIARRSLAGRGSTGSLLFVCVGNIYRSPFAAGAFTAALPPAFRDLVRCASAGFTGPDRGSPPDAVAAAAARGVDLRGHRSALLSAQRVTRAQLVVVMDAEQKREIRRRFGRAWRDVLVLGDLDPLPIETRRIADPWDGTPEVLEASYDRIRRCTRELARLLLAG